MPSELRGALGCVLLKGRSACSGRPPRCRDGFYLGPCRVFEPDWHCPDRLVVWPPICDGRRNGSNRGPESGTFPCPRRLPAPSAPSTATLPGLAPVGRRHGPVPWLGRLAPRRPCAGLRSDGQGAPGSDECGPPGHGRGRRAGAGNTADSRARSPRRGNPGRTRFPGGTARWKRNTSAGRPWASGWRPCSRRSGPNRKR